MQWPTLAVDISFTSDSVKAFVQRDLTTAATWTDVTAYVLGFGYQRGRQRQLGRAEAGTGYLLLDNADGRFDPENSSSAYYGNYGTGVGEGMRPGKHVRIRATYSGTTYNLLYMFVTDWPPTELSRQGDPVVRVALADHIAWLARTTNQVTTADAQAPWEQIEEILTTEDVPAAFQLLDTSGEASLVPTSASSGSGNPWSVIQSYADSEEGSIVFANGSGQYTYHDHARRYGVDRSIVVQATFDNGPGAPSGAVPYVKVDYTRDTNDLNVRFQVTPAGVGMEEAYSVALEARYYMRTTSRSTRHKFGAQALRMAQRLRSRVDALWENHSLTQHTSLAVEAAGTSTALWPKVLGLEISDLIKVTERLYPGTRTRTIPSFIEGMQVDVDLQHWSWRVTYRLSRALSAYHWIIGGKGVAFPTSPVTNDLFYRTDLALLCYYDGTRWLTAPEYETSPIVGPALQPFSAGQSVGYWPKHPTYDRYITSLNLAFNVQTTNNGSNYWTIRLVRLDTGATLTSDLSTAAASAGAWVNTNINLTLLTGAYPIGLNIVKNGAPGNMYVASTLSYRLVVT